MPVARASQWENTAPISFLVDAGSGDGLTLNHFENCGSFSLEMSLRRTFRAVLVLTIAFAFIQTMSVQASSEAGQQKKTNCNKPPEFIPPPKQPKGKKQPKTKIRGDVAIEISEDGEVVAAKAVHPSSEEAAKQSESFAKSMKFKARPGCGVFRTVVSYNLGD